MELELFLQKTIKTQNMGCYICMGSVFSYSIPKEKLFNELDDHRIKDKNESEIIDELIKNFPMDVYSLSTTEKRYHISLRDDVSVNDFINLYDSFYKTIPPRPYREEEIEMNRADMAQMKTMNEVWNYINSPKYNFARPIYLPSYLYLKKYQLFDKEIWISTSVYGPKLYVDTDRIVSEGSLAPFEIFTDLLQHRFKEQKLGKTLLAYISV